MAREALRHPSRVEKRVRRAELIAAQREREGKPLPFPKGQRGPFDPPPFTPPRKVKHANWPDEIPRLHKQMAELYTEGYSPESIYAILRCPEKPHTIRRILKKWGVVMRGPGGNGGAGLSLLPRVADLEVEVADLRHQLAMIVNHLALSPDQ